MTRIEAIIALHECSLDALGESIYYAHKDHYGVKGHHMAGSTKGELIDWWLAHYEWDPLSMAWGPKGGLWGNDIGDEYYPESYDEWLAANPEMLAELEPDAWGRMLEALGDPPVGLEVYSELAGMKRLGSASQLSW